jgi:hypothetical protein
MTAALTTLDRRVRWRKLLIRERALLLDAWERAFPAHDFSAGRLREQSTRSLAAEAWANPGWAKAAREYHRDKAGRPVVADTEPERLTLLRRLLDDNISLEPALNDPSGRPTPQVTIEAILHCVRERGLAVLKEPANLERLACCDAAAKSEIDRRIRKLIGHYV